MIREGTCARSDHENFYPAGLPKPAQITYYARFFPLVEVDSSFYRPSSARNCALWTERTPPEFRFHVKAYRALTWHDREAAPIRRASAIWRDSSRTPSSPGVRRLSWPRYASISLLRAVASSGLPSARVSTRRSSMDGHYRAGAGVCSKDSHVKRRGVERWVQLSLP